jgi:hypothetical protein
MNPSPTPSIPNQRSVTQQAFGAYQFDSHIPSFWKIQLLRQLASMIATAAIGAPTMTETSAASSTV